ncbi:dipeptide ABC transporter ATP-binding protein [Methanolobus psychrotolerans]|uniref:dipeptide ABC transporter ATP-binding protein n=1 Tax=Methanolobus psychrotolerans TaxID=1874706 RepID=UPI000B919192|nr:ABC transporter ATP-binding protein [Methanolobus psychrotolerans]
MSLLKIKDLKCHYQTDAGIVKAVDGISFEIDEGEILGIVGESGSGKTTIALGIMGILPENTTSSGDIIYRDHLLSSLYCSGLDRFRWNDIAIVFQNGLEVLNPVMKLRTQITEPMMKHLDISLEKARSKCADLFRTVRLDPKWLDAYPHQLSGGMRQRFLLAMALACDPKLLILDEVTSALDAFTRREIRDLLVDLQKMNGYTMLMISHDLTFVSSVASRVAVMYSGRVVETGPVKDILSSPRHPYTRGLVHSTPDIFAYKDLWGIPGDIPAGTEFKGCPFCPRCTQKIKKCNEATPNLIPVEGGREIACHRGGVAGLLQAKDLNHSYRLPDGQYLKVVDDVNLEVKEGEVLAIIGQTGSGKSTLAHILANVIRSESGNVLFMGESICKCNLGKNLNGIQIVFQDPFSSTNNRFTVLDAIKEPLDINKIGLKEERLQMVKSTLELVHLPVTDDFLRKYCGELSGGQRQRVALARAMVMEPKLLIADEITSALDVSTSANVLRLLKGLQNRRGFAMIYISHDLSMTLKIADRIAVMDKGRIVEMGNSHDVMFSPSDEYTKRLVGSRLGLCCHTH